MQQFIDKLISRLEERHEDYRNKYLLGKGNLQVLDGCQRGLEDAVSIVNQLAEEHKNDKVYQLSMMYANSLTMYGVDITGKLETATQQTFALNEAYLRGRHDEREKFEDMLADEYKGGWIPVSERLPDVANSYLVTRMCENDGNPIYETAHEIFWTNDGKWDCERDEYCDWKVTAWREKLSPYQKEEEHKPRTNFDMCCERIENMAQIIDIAKVGWSKKQIIEWLQSEVKDGEEI